jgi:hypothetical protein
MFFSEEKNQKTFASGAADRSGTWPESDAWAVGRVSEASPNSLANSRIYQKAREQMSFGSAGRAPPFLQKKTFLP